MSNVSTPDSTAPTGSEGAGSPEAAPDEGGSGSGASASRELDPRQPAAMALGLAASDQRRDVAVGLLVQLAAHDVGVLEDAAAMLDSESGAPDPETRRRARGLLDAAVRAARTVTGPKRRVDLDGLLDNAALFDSPSDYRAGVLDAIEAMDLRDED